MAIQLKKEVCHLAAKAAAQFATAGFPVMEMEGGFKSWKEHELPTDVGSGAQPPSEQVAS